MAELPNENSKRFIAILNKKIVDEIIGWYGTIAIVTAYGLLSFGILSSTALVYQLLNASGALGIVYLSFKKKTYQPGVLNIIWMIIATVAIVRMFI